MVYGDKCFLCFIRSRRLWFNIFCVKWVVVYYVFIRIVVNCKGYIFFDSFCVFYVNFNVDWSWEDFKEWSINFGGDGDINSEWFIKGLGSFSVGGENWGGLVVVVWFNYIFRYGDEIEVVFIFLFDL